LIWPLSREIVTELLFIEDLGVILFIGLYLRAEYVAKGMYGLKRRLASKFAIGFGIYILGHAIVRLWSISMYLIKERETPTFELEDVYPIGLTGLLLAMIGMAFAIRVISPAPCIRWGWIAVLAASIVFVIIMRYL
jgi:hypothetical protein